ncbi:MAG: NrdH-redoxin [Chloroflexi bacterium]|nr:NrdH-redoxin [Chloroflexota bacterium]
MANDGIVMYGTTWCGDCRRSKRYFEANNVAFTWIDIEQDPNAAAIVRQANDGKQVVPTIIFPDGSMLMEPSNAQLAAKLGI